MADDSGLLGGIDPEELIKRFQAMAQHMGPSEADQHTAKMHALLAAGLGILGNSDMPVALAAGQGGLLGLQSYNDELQRIGQQRQQGLQSISSLMPIMMQAQQQKMLSGVNFGGTNSPVTSPGDPNAAQTAGNVGGASALTSAFDPAVSELLNSGKQSYAQAAQPSVRSSGANTGNKTIDQAINMGIAPETVRMILSGPNGFAELGKVMAEYGKRGIVRPGTVTGGLDPNSGNYKIDFSNPNLPQGMQLTADQQAVDVPGAQEGLFRQSLRPLIAKGMTTPLSTVGPGGGQQVTAGRTEADLFPSNLPNVGQGKPRSRFVDSQGNNTAGSPVATTGPTSYQTTLGPGEAESDKGFAELGNVRAKELFERGALGNQQVARFTELNNLLTKFNPSIASPWRLEAARIAGAAGLDKDTQRGIAGGDPGAMIAFNKLGFEGALQLLKSYTPRFTQSEVAQALMNNPNIALTKEGNQLVLETGKAAALLNRPGFRGGCWG